MTIVLPTRGGVSYLRSSIDSCLRQSLSSLELIAVDDGSADGTSEQLESLARHDSRVRVFRHRENQGLPRALNTGFAAARGRYLTWTSDDNLYASTAIERMAWHLDSDESLGTVYADYTVIDGDGRSVRAVRVGEPGDLFTHNCVGPCFLYRRSVAQAVGEYRDELSLAEDYDYWLRVFARFRIAPMHGSLYLYREHQDSLTARGVGHVRRATSQALADNLPALSKAGRRVPPVAFLSVSRGMLPHRPCRSRWYAFRYLCSQPKGFLKAALSEWGARLLLGNHVAELLKRVVHACRGR